MEELEFVRVRPENLAGLQTITRRQRGIFICVGGFGSKWNNRCSAGRSQSLEEFICQALLIGAKKKNRKCKSHIGIEFNAEWSVQMSESQSEEEGLEIGS